MQGMLLHPESAVTVTAVARLCSLLALFGISLVMDCSITAKEFEPFRALIYHECGISLNDSKKMLFVSWLSKRLRPLALDSFQAHYGSVSVEDDIICASCHERTRVWKSHNVLRKTPPCWM